MWGCRDDLNIASNHKELPIRGGGGWGGKEVYGKLMYTKIGSIPKTNIANKQTKTAWRSHMLEFRSL